MTRLIRLAAILLIATPVLGQSVPAWRQVIPVVASVNGNNGAHWSTDLIIHNPSETLIQVRLDVRPSQGSLVAAVGSGQTGHFPADQFLPGATAGTLVITATDAEDHPMPVVARARIWTTGPDGVGTFGQGIPAVPWAEDGDLDTRDRTLLGLERSDAFRSNLGLVNLSETTEAVYRIDLLDADGTVLGSHWTGVAPSSRLQLNSLPAMLGIEGDDLTASVHLIDWNPLTPGVPGQDAPAPDWITYASKVDNRTNDPTFITALPETTKWGITRQRIVPVAAHTEGDAGSFWVTDLVAHHAGDRVPTFLQVDVIPTGDQPVGSPSSFTIPIYPDQTIAIDDVIGDRFPSHDVAALIVKGWNGGALYSDLKVQSRTWTTADDGEGTLGQSIAGLPRRYGEDPVVVPGLFQTTDFRSNLGIANPSTNLRQMFAIEILDVGGQTVGQLEQTLEPMSHTQINGILEGLDLAGGPFTAVVRLADSENLFLRRTDPWDPIFAAYGSTVDNRTNDPTFITGIPLPPPPDPDPGDWVDFEEDEPWYRCPDTEPPAEATVVRTFNQAYHYFGSENRRTIVEAVDFPDGGDWNQVGLRIHLECPESGDCDDWDRTASLQMVLNPDEPEDQWEYLELARYITPYHLEMCESIDLTDLAPLLSGPQTLVSWIDTWVGPGHASGEGWRVTYDFVFYPGAPRTPDEVHNVWPLRTVTVGDPMGNPIETQIDPVEIAIPADATRVEARLITTGHSFGNSENCAEFCELRQDVFVNGQMFSVLPWRTDCEYNPHSPQAGTWTYDRNGWCPGAVVVGDTLDLTDAVAPGETATIDLDIRMMDGSVYENTVTGQPAPIEWISMQVFVYR